MSNTRVKILDGYYMKVATILQNAPPASKVVYITDEINQLLYVIQVDLINQVAVTKNKTSFPIVVSSIIPDKIILAINRYLKILSFA